jgi:hypothetical protein
MLIWRRVEYVARSRQVCINWVVEALLVAIYLTEKKDVYIHIRPTLLPEATSLPKATLFSWGLPSGTLSYLLYS